LGADHRRFRKLPLGFGLLDLRFGLIARLDVLRRIDFGEHLSLLDEAADVDLLDL
jgi:hypothetical protein